jgi:hypothetical protein
VQVNHTLTSSSMKCLFLFLKLTSACKFFRQNLHII